MLLCFFLPVAVHTFTGHVPVNSLHAVRLGNHRCPSVVDAHNCVLTAKKTSGIDVSPAAAALAQFLKEQAEETVIESPSRTSRP